ncbi:hypothetical protein CC99x_011890 [Candidatus Berkiella cookevillensis]|uniref:T2SS substrate NttA domain-containing protein n=1 Tax=Candidatus Berkiella cookevillensis TaxID=437022 RepID=A0A0Q9YN99_9GAMM|nr:hypothetical protein [Candidatus Berkiella cookevillensis]MCS5709597.1 hypothetical protein [Candidatus Berkiella cookevillensis]
MIKAMLLRIGVLLCCCFLPVALLAETNNSNPPAPHSLKPPKLVEQQTNSRSTETAPSNTPTLNHEPKPIDKYVWLSRMKELLPAQLCGADEYFLKCFDIEQASCKQFSEIYLTACLDQIAPKLPAKLSTTDGQKWGQMMGRCTHDLFNKFMADKKKALPECTDVSKLKSPSPKT